MIFCPDGSKALEILSTQSTDANNFYAKVTGRSIFDGFQANVLLTGHSLGGGLAGYIAAITGDSATIFDNMPYAQAATNSVILKDIADGFTDFSGLLGGTDSAPVPLPSAGSITSIFTGGEILKSARVAGPIATTIPNAAYLAVLLVSAGVSVSEAAIDAAEAVSYADSIPDQETDLPPLNSAAETINAIDLHSMALLVLLRYASDNNFTDWQQIGPQLFVSYFDDKIATAIGITTSEAATAAPADQMIRMIAYSAIDFRCDAIWRYRN